MEKSFLFEESVGSVPDSPKRFHRVRRQRNDMVHYEGTHRADATLEATGLIKYRCLWRSEPVDEVPCTVCRCATTDKAGLSFLPMLDNQRLMASCHRHVISRGEEGCSDDHC